MQKQPPEVFCKKGMVKKLAIFTEKHLCWAWPKNGTRTSEPGTGDAPQSLKVGPGTAL